MDAMREGTVSVVVPTYNYGGYVGAALDSILCQSYREVEVIVVDDGSDDDTTEIMGTYAASGRVRYVRQPRSGVSAARNRGIAEARGEFLAFLDADDTWPEPDMLSQGVRYLRAHPSVGWIFGDAEPFNEDGVLDEPYLHKGGYYQGYSAEPEIRRITPADLCNNDRFFIPTGTILVRRSCIDAIGPFDTTLNMFEDTDMWLRLIRFPVAFSRQVLLARRVHGGNLSDRRWQYLPELKQLIERYTLENYGVSYAVHAGRGNYLAGRHWLREREYDRARAAFRDSATYASGWRPALFMLIAAGAGYMQTALGRHPGDKA